MLVQGLFMFLHNPVFKGKGQSNQDKYGHISSHVARVNQYQYI